MIQLRFSAWHSCLCFALMLGSTGVASAAETNFTLINSKDDIKPDLARVFTHIAESEYNVTWQPTVKAYQSPNREQNLRFTYGNNGFSVKRRAPEGQGDDWQVKLNLKGYGAEDPLPDTAPAHFQTDKHAVRVTTDAVVFDYTNSPGGMRQTFTILRKPKAGKLTLDLALEMNGLTLEVRSNAACFQDPATKAPVMTYNNLKVWDATGRMLAATMRSSGAARMAIEVDDTAALYPVVVDPTVASFINGRSNGDQFGFSVAYMGAYVDAVFLGGYQFGGVLIGAPWYDAGLTGQGAAWVYARVDGTHSGNWTYSELPEDGYWTGSQANENFGYSVAVAYSFMTPEATGSLQGPVSGYVISYPGVIVGAPNFSTNGLNQCGAAFVYYGRCGSSIVNSNFDGCTNEPYPATADWVTYGTEAGAKYGYCVATGGSLTGDGYHSVVVGAPYFTTTNLVTGNLHGAVYIYPGSITGLSNSPAVVLTGSTTANDNFGWSLACAGDINGDGFDDLIVGAPNRQQTGIGPTGAAMIYTGGPNGIFGATPNTPQYTLWGSQAYEQFGYCACGAWSLYGSGSWDVAVGAPRHKVGTAPCGSVYLFAGPLTPGNTTAYTTLLLPPIVQPLSYFGASVAAGMAWTDTDSDGDPWDMSETDDLYSVCLLVGAPKMSTDDIGYQSGAVFLYPNGPTQSPEEVEGPVAGCYFGWSVAGMTPWDSGFFVGAPGYGQYFPNPGSVSVIYP